MTADQRVDAPIERFGGIAFMASGVLFLAKSVLDLIVGGPPSTSPQLLAWASSHHTSLASTNEVLFFAAVSLIPAVPALYRGLNGPNRRAVGFGCGVLVTAIPVMLVLVIVHGRLVYPVFGIDVATPDSIALVTSLYYGGSHLTSLLIAMAAVTLGLCMWHKLPAVGGFGVLVGVSQVMASYPWMLGATAEFVAQALLAAWLFLNGATLAGPRPSHG